MWRSALAAVLLTATLVAGCDDSGCSKGEVNVTDLAVEEPDVPWVPEDAPVVLHGRGVEEVLGVLEVSTSGLAEDAAIPTMRAVWATNFGYDPFGVDNWRAWGFEPKRPFTLVRTEERWMVVAQAEDPEKFERYLERKASEGELRVEDSKRGDFEIWEVEMTPPRGEGQAMVAARRDGWWIMAPTGRLDPRATLGKEGEPWPIEAFGEMLQEWANAPVAKRWANDRQVQAMRGGWAQKSDVVGSLRPQPFLERIESKGQGEVLRNRLVRQSGTFYVATDVDAPSRNVTVRMRSPGNPAAPAFVRDLQGATGKVPRIGGLADPGILAIVRLSVDPEKAWGLLRSGLPPEDRRALDTIFTDLDAKLKVDARKMILDNLHGHVFVFVYGFQEDVLTPDNPTFVPDLFRLQATREAVLLPVKGTEKLERVLDISTQLSKGKLTRQDLDGKLQYAWSDDGPLSWAVIVGSDHALIVDSSAAFDHATVYERGARRLPEVLVDRKVDQLLDGTQRSGLYVDLASLANILIETGNETGRWLTPYTSGVLTTEMGEEAGELTLDLTLKEIPKPSGSSEGPGGAFEPL